jgi:hypothetical protein
VPLLAPLMPERCSVGEPDESALRDRVGSFLTNLNASWPLPVNARVLTGTVIGCGRAECGSCTVLVGPRPVQACAYPATQSDGSDVLTVEGLSRDETLHPLQESFPRHGAVQCGFCTLAF